MRRRTARRNISRRQFVAAATAQAATTTLATAAAGERPAESSSPMRLHVIGSGCPAPTPNRYGSSFILEVGKTLAMIDCGPATTYKMARMGIKPARIGHLFFTHHHFDHNVDFPCFALTRWDLNDCGGPPLKVYGPPPTRTFVDRLLGKEGAFFDDINSRITHPVSLKLFTGRGGVLPRPVPTFDVRELGPGEVLRSKNWVVRTTRVHHVEPELKSLAYRFDTEHGSIVFAGDCGDCKTLRELAKDADALVIACVYIGSSRYEGIITGTGDISRIANASGARRVVLSHAAPSLGEGKAKKQAVAAVARTYDGAVCFPEELTTIDL